MKYFRMKLGVMKDKETGERIKEDVEYIQREEDKALIPCVEGNADYQAYLDDTEKVVEDYDYEAEEARQAAAEAAKAGEPTEEEIQAELREMAKQNIINKKEK
jgi:hypothetical protein